MEQDSTAFSDSESCSDSHFSLAHSTEQEVNRELLSREDWMFHSLVVHRTRGGICLQGVLECDDPHANDEIDQIARKVARVDEVINQIVIQKTNDREPPLKG